MLEQIADAAWIGALWGVGIGVAGLISSVAVIVVMIMFRAIDEWDR